MNKNYIGFRKHVITFLKSLFASAYPNYMGMEEDRNCEKSNRELENAKINLEKALKSVVDSEGEIINILKKYFEELPSVLELIKTDVTAGYDGDPAATSEDEVILCYPAFIAISTYRFAHPLYKLHVKIIPRIMTEYAHGKTGIDIHPGAEIGKSFFIDHGTGVVIGETTTIGDNVKIYQGVTLGALSTKGGQKLKGLKRHPGIGNNVTIYSNATILGGETIIKDNETVPGNAFIVTSL
jgi:serine O-acetyltransferase